MILLSIIFKDYLNQINFYICQQLQVQMYLILFVKQILLSMSIQD